jgi:hypothetical protein
MLWLCFGCSGAKKYLPSLGMSNFTFGGLQLLKDHVYYMQVQRDKTTVSFYAFYVISLRLLLLFLPRFDVSHLIYLFMV